METFRCAKLCLLKLAFSRKAHLNAHLIAKLSTVAAFLSEPNSSQKRATVTADFVKLVIAYLNSPRLEAV